MYSHTFLVTSVRGSVDLPQIAANASLSFFGANAFFLPVAFCAVLPNRRFSAVVFFNSAFVIVAFFVVVVATVVFVVVVVVIARGRVGVHTL